jgi:hypothetical protein
MYVENGQRGTKTHLDRDGVHAHVRGARRPRRGLEVGVDLLGETQQQTTSRTNESREEQRTRRVKAHESRFRMQKKKQISRHAKICRNICRKSAEKFAEKISLWHFSLSQTCSACAQQTTRISRTPVAASDSSVYSSIGMLTSGSSTWARLAMNESEQCKCVNAGVCG